MTALATGPSASLGGRRGMIRDFIRWIMEEKAEHAGDADAPKGTAASIAFVAPDGKVLFVKRAATEENWPDTWSWPGGRADGAETPTEAAIREAKEEIGRNCDPDKLVEIEKKRTPYGWDHTAYRHAVDAAFDPTLNDEHSAFVWRPADDPPDPLHPGVKATLDKMLADLAEDVDFKRNADGTQQPTLSLTEPLPYTTQQLREEGTLAAATRHPASDADPNPDGKLSETTRENIGESGSEHREEMPESAFLGPDRTYPVQELRDRVWHYTRNLLLAAARRARLQGRNDIANKADAIREREFPGAADMAMDWSSVVELVNKEPVGFAFDRESVREKDVDGRLHVVEANLCKACVSPYWGREIPGFSELGLDPDRKYMLLRDPEELAKPDTVASFNRLPILDEHIPESAENHNFDITIGSTGSTAIYEHPFIRNSLAFWPQSAIDDIESNTKKELSPSYRYRADMTPGTYEGAHFDGRMTDIRANHLCLVREGRQGADVVVADSAIAPAWADVERLIFAI